MSWVYNSSNGVLSHNGGQVGTGYSGHPPHVNDPSAQAIPDTGPIPIGSYMIGDAMDHPRLGPLAMPLTPALGTNTFGRSGFFIHGDSLAKAGQEEASHGCIILAHPIRLLISLSEDRELEVV